MGANVTHTLRTVRTPEQLDRIAWAGLERLAERNLERLLMLSRPVQTRPLTPGQALMDSERECNLRTPVLNLEGWSRINEARLTLEAIRSVGRSLGALRMRQKA